MDGQVIFPVAAVLLSISTAALALVANKWRNRAMGHYASIDWYSHLVSEANAHISNLQRELSDAYDNCDKADRRAREVEAELKKINEQRNRALDAARASNARKAAAKADDASARRLKTVSELATTQLRPRAEVVAGAKREIA